MSLSFNPRPLLLTGESGVELLDETEVYKFQSTPVIANGRIGSEFGVSAPGILFQSTPVIANGRINLKFSAFGSRANRFNPRPLLLTGESQLATKRTAAATTVSIHARYC